jgi:hypothetical protein
MYMVLIEFGMEIILLKIYIRIVPHALPTKERRLYILLCYIPPASSILAILAFLFIIFENLPFQHVQHILSAEACLTLTHTSDSARFVDTSYAARLCQS